MKTALHLSHTDIRFDSRILKEINSLINAGYEVSSVGVHGAEETKESSISRDYENYSIILRSRNLKFLPKTIRHIISLFELTGKMLYRSLKLSPDIIHCHDTLVLPLGIILKILTKSKLIYDAHELESDRNGITRVQSRLTYWVEKSLWKFVDGLIVVSPSIEAWYIQNIGPKNSIVILNSPVFGKVDHQNEQYLRQYFSISKSSKIFIYVGILGDGRGLDLIVRAFQHPDINSSLVLLGYGELKDELKSTAEHSNNIYLHNAVPHEQVVSVVSSADYGLCLIQNISLSDYYCLPNKLFEYCFSGIPVLASAFPDLKQIVKDYNLGICCDLNLDEIVSSIKELEDGNIDFHVDDDRLSELSWEAQEKKLYMLYSNILCE